MQDQAASDGKQASKSRKCPSSGSANGRSAVNGDGSPSASSPQIVVNSKDDVQAIAQHLASQPTLHVPRTDAWGVLTPISEKAKTRPQASHIFFYNNEHVLGRLVKDSSCQFDSINVSARHCTIFRKKFKADETCIPLQGTEPVSGDRWLVYIKDSSSNGTFINWQKLKKDSPEARIKDGDIISLVNAPEHENAFAFLYQEIKPNSQTLLTHQVNGAATNALKRKNTHDGENIGECISGDSKRVKGLGIGGPDGPVSLDDVRRLQRSNEELRNQLEAHVLTIEKLRAESRAATARHDAEIKEIKETLSVAFLGQIQDLGLDIGKKEKEIDNYASLCAQHQSKLEDVNQSLFAANQSRKDADEVIQSQNLNIAELKEQLEDERSQRRNEREKAEADLKSAVDRARTEASEELKRQSETAARQQREQLEMINKLQEADKENRALVEALRCKLEDLRENLVKAERTSRSLELRLHEEEISLAVARKKILEKEEELQLASKDLQEEKAAREEALAKLASLEVEMESAIQDLSLEKQRLQGARERIVLRETQLRAFHSTAEEIAGLQQKQQEQLQAMMRVLEDGDDENMACQNHGTGMMAVVIDDGNTCTKGVQKDDADKRVLSNDDTMANDGRTDDESDADSQTAAGDCPAGGVLTRATIEEWGDGDTQVDDSAGLVDAPKDVQVATMQYTRKGSEPSMPLGAEGGYTQLLETESNTAGKLITGKYPNETERLGSGRDDAALLQTTRVCAEVYHRGEEENTVKALDDEGGGLGGETMQLEDEDDQEVRHWERRQLQAESLQKATKSNEKQHEGKPAWPPDKLGHGTHAGKENYGARCSRAQDQPELMSRRDAPLTTLDLLTSEVAGSWALSTPASVHCENDGSSESEDRDEGIEKVTHKAHIDFAASQVGNCGRNVMSTRLHQPRGETSTTCAASQSSLSPRTIARHDRERRDLNTMLDIVAPDFSRLHGLDRVIQSAPDSEDHHSEEEEYKDDETDGDSAESQSQ